MNATTMPPAATGLMTAEEFGLRHAGDAVELIDGVVEPIPMAGFQHGEICGNMVGEIGAFVKATRAGRIVCNDTFVLTRRNPDRVRGADVAFWATGRVPEGTHPPGVVEIPPDLVVEVRSPTDTWSAAFAKVVEYLAAGVRVAVLVDPRSATASVFRPDELQQIFDNGDEFTLPDVLPGFAVPVKRFFE